MQVQSYGQSPNNRSSANKYILHYTRRHFVVPLYFFPIRRTPCPIASSWITECQSPLDSQLPVPNESFLERPRPAEHSAQVLKIVPPTISRVYHRLRGLTSQLPGKIEKVVLEGINSVQGIGVCPGRQRSPNTPRDQEGHRREGDADGKHRRQLAAEKECLETKGNGERYRATDQRCQTGESRVAQCAIYHISRLTPRAATNKASCI